MAFETKVPYRVTQKILKKWLEENIGKEHDAAGKPCWKYVVSLHLSTTVVRRTNVP